MGGVEKIKKELEERAEIISKLSKGLTVEDGTLKVVIDDLEVACKLLGGTYDIVGMEEMYGYGYGYIQECKIRNPMRFTVIYDRKKKKASIIIDSINNKSFEKLGLGDILGKAKKEVVIDKVVSIEVNPDNKIKSVLEDENTSEIVVEVKNGIHMYVNCNSELNAKGITIYEYTPPY